MNPDKFEFDIGFQWEILNCILLDPNGYKVLTLVSPEYFDLENQRIIVKATLKYFKKVSRVPVSAAFLNEEIKGLFKTKDYARSFTEIERKKILKKVRGIYKKGKAPRDFEEVLDKCRYFASYVKVKHTLEEIDISDVNKYETHLRKLQDAIRIGNDLENKPGTLLVGSSRIRLVNRHNKSDIIPTPWAPLNHLTNAGGYTKGSIMVILDRPKKGKTTALVNIATAYSKNRAFKTNNIIYIDMENGEENISTRFDQCLLGKNKLEILSGEHDAKINKMYRMMKRFKCEIYIVRLPAYSTTNDFQRVLDEAKQEFGLEFKIAVIDYIALMGCLSGKTEDTPRISDAYLDVKNWAKKNDIYHVWTGHHVVRAAYKRRLTKYQPDDTAKCIDIERHVDAMFGLQQSEEDIKASLVRLEIIEQRDGVPFGRVILKESVKVQRLIPLHPSEQREYNLAFGELFNEGQGDETKSEFRRKKNKRGDI